jgi:hypothetical protein
MILKRDLQKSNHLLIRIPLIPNTISANNFNHMNQIPNLDFNSEEIGENIKVCLRIRPFSNQELSRGDEKCIQDNNNTNVNFKNKNINRSYTFNHIFGEKSSQEDLFFQCSMNVIYY